MAWTTFAALGTGPATPDMLDGNFNILTVRAPFDCTVSGTNTLTMVPVSGATGLGVFTFGTQFSGIAANSNTGAVTVSVTGFTGSFPVYKDIVGGPAVLTGGEIVAGTLFTLFFDQALNGNAGGFHLLSAAFSSAGGSPIFSVVTAGTVTASLVNVTSLASIANASLASITWVRGIGTSLQLGGGDFITRFNSQISAVAFGQITPNTIVASSVTFAGVSTLDNIFLGFGTAGPGSVTYQPYVSASGTIVINAFTSAPVTIAAATLTMRITDLGFAV